jgi:hypothetical protein
MFKNAENLYQKIAESLMELSNNINKDWLEIYYTIDLRNEGVIEDSCEYLSANGENKYISLFDNDYGLPKLFKELYQTMTVDTDKHKWNRAKVTLTNDGKLNIKFEWDQELADELKRLEDEYDPRWDDSLSQEEKDKKYKEMVKNGELPDLSGIIVKK